jgi:hypothetical protein
MTWLQQKKADWNRLKEQYGKVAIGTYLALWVLVLATYFIGLQVGFDMKIKPEGSGFGAILVGSWAFAKLSQIPRIIITIAITPTVAKWLNKEPVLVGEE